MTRPFEETDVASAQWAVAVTPDDNTDIPPSRALYVGSGGDVAMELAGKRGTAVTFKNVATGAVLTVNASRVKSTGTTANNILALY